MGSGLTGKRVTFVDVLRVREFRVLWIADSQSAIGDQIARVALSVLVFQKTASPILTALTYALTFLPALIGGPLLSGLADRLPRRRVLIWCDLIRAVLFALMAIPGMPFAVLAVLLVVAVLVESPFVAAESALVPAILADDHYVVGTGLRTISNQLAQLAGFGLGALAIQLIGARPGLAVDGASFALSAVLIAAGVRARPVPAPGADGEHDAGFGIASMAAGFRLIFSNPRLRTLVGLAWLAGLYVVPEGVAAPYAEAIDHRNAVVGFLMAAMPAGTALGTYIFVRWVPATSRSSWMGPMGIAAGIPLMLCWKLPGLPVSLVLWALAGFFFSYQVQVVTEFVRAVPDHQRGQAVGIASSGLLAVQGIGVLLGGVVTEAVGVGWAVAGAGAVGVALAICLTAMWSRAQQGATTDGNAGVMVAEELT